MIMTKQNRKSIGFLRSGTHPQNLLSYKKILNRQSIDVFAVCDGYSEKNQYDSSLKIYCFEDWLKDNWNYFKTKDLKKYQDKYSKYCLWEIYYTDRYIRYKYSYEEAVLILIGLITFWENIFSNENVVCIASDCIIGAYNFFGMIVGEKYGVRYVSFPTSRTKQYVTYFSEEEGYRNVILKKFLDENYCPSEIEIENTRKYIEDYILNKNQPFYIKSSVNQSKKFFNTLMQLAKKINKISYLWDGRFSDRYDTRLYKSRWSFLEPVWESIRVRFVWKYFERPDFDNDRYVLFPLHFQPEASTCVYARKYENQLFFLEQLAKSIPAGMVIYVKEHSVRIGHRPLSFYKEVKKYPNIKLISPKVNIHDLIKKSEFLVVLTSTAGYEALMYGKPVFVCGNVFFEDFSGVKVIHDIFDEKESFYTPPEQDRELYIRQMACYLKSLNVCSTVEEQLFDEDKKTLKKLQETTIKSLLDYLDITKRSETQRNERE